MEISRLLLAIFGIVLLAEGIIYAIFPKKTAKIMAKLFKNDMLVKEIGLIEIIAGLAVMLITLLI